jgi:heat shock protein HtpX
MDSVPKKFGQDLRIVSKEIFNFTISPEIPEGCIGDLYEFIYKSVLLTYKDRFANIEKAMEPNKWVLTYSVVDKKGKAKVRVQLVGGKPLAVSVTPLVEAVSQDEIQTAREDVVLAVNAFEEQLRKNTWFFAWRQGDNVVPERISSTGNRSSRFFVQTQILLMILFVGLQMLLFYFLGVYFAIAVLAIQFVVLFYSNKIITKMADWHITKKDPFIHILEYSLSPENKEAVSKLPRKQLLNLKKEVYAETIAQHGEIDRQKCSEIFDKYGINCQLEDFAARKVNAYGLVEETAGKFGFSMPEVVVSNTLAPNAAASGPSPNRGTVMMTTGLFLELQDDEILSVLGHEFGHLKGRDPLILFGLSSAEFLFRFYVLLPFVPAIVFDPFLFLLYFGAVTTVIYFFAKFLEARADLTSAMVVGQPNVLADSLEKIGYKSLLLERKPSFRVQEWLSMDAHPPIYFRIARLRKLNLPVKVGHPFIDSAREVLSGFRQSLSS